jgi:hypothetical protein
VVGQRQPCRLGGRGEPRWVTVARWGRGSVMEGGKGSFCMAGGKGHGTGEPGKPASSTPALIAPCCCIVTHCYIHYQYVQARSAPGPRLARACHGVRGARWDVSHSQALRRGVAPSPPRQQAADHLLQRMGREGGREGAKGDGEVWRPGEHRERARRQGGRQGSRRPPQEKGRGRGRGLPLCPAALHPARLSGPFAVLLLSATIT